jgi:hypothetical protein
MIINIIDKEYIIFILIFKIHINLKKIKSNHFPEREHVAVLSGNPADLMLSIPPITFFN